MIDGCHVDFWNFKAKKVFAENTKIEILDKMDLSRNIIAIITGSTPKSVSAIKSMKKPKSSRPKPQKVNEGVEQQNEQKTV